LGGLLARAAGVDEVDADLAGRAGDERTQ